MYVHNLQLFVTGVYSSLGIYDIHSYTQYIIIVRYTHTMCVCVCVSLCIYVSWDAKHTEMCFLCLP